MRYLFLRDNRYYFRRKIPKPLSCIIGKQILCFSLNTDSISRARNLILKHTLLADDLFAKAETRRAGCMTNEEFKIVLAHYYEMVLNELRENFNSRYEEIKEQRVTTEKHQKEADQHIHKTQSYNEWETRINAIPLSSQSPEQRDKIAQIKAQITKHGQLSKDIEEAATLVSGTHLIHKGKSKLDEELIRVVAQSEVAKTEVDLDKLHQEMNFETHEKKGLQIAQALGFDCSNLPPQFYAQLSIAAKEASHHASVELLEGEQYKTPERYSTHQAKEVGNKVIHQEDYNLTNLFKKFCDEDEQNVRPATLSAKKTTFKEFIDIVGEVRVSELTHELARNYVQALKQLPSNYAKKYHQSPLEAINIAPKNAKKTAPVTINDKIRVISYFFDWCINQGFFLTSKGENVLKGKTLKIKKNGSNKNTYQPYTKGDLKNLFGELFLKHTIKKPFHFWLPLIALYTGARISEIVMLRTEDVKKTPEGQQYFEFCAYYDGKTKNAHRTIPIHPDLIELGLLKFVSQQRRKKTDRILNCITIPSNPQKHKGNNASKWFNDTFLNKFEKAGLISPADINRKKKFHSFRGTVITNLRENKANPAYINTVIGHADFTMQGKYADEYSVQFQFEEVISKIQYTEIDIEILKRSRHAR